MIQIAPEQTTLSAATFVNDYATYNRWANEQLVAWLQTKSADLMTQEVPSSFSSLRKTLVHIGNTERWWLYQLQQVAPALSEQALISESEDVFDALLSRSDELAAYVESLPEWALDEPGEFSIPYVGDFSESKRNMIQHCVNHNTYHRGQLVTIGRNLGFTDAPMTDYMFYCLMVR